MVERCIEETRRLPGFFIDLWIAFLSRDDLNHPGASSDQLGYHADMGVHQRDKETMIRYEGNIHLHRG